MKTWPSLVLIGIGLAVVLWILISVTWQPAPEKWTPEPLVLASPTVTPGQQRAAEALPSLALESTPTPSEQLPAPAPAEPIVPPVASASPSPTPEVTPQATPTPTPEATPEATPATTPAPSTPTATAATPTAYMEVLRGILQRFRTETGSEPTGSNREITAALRGGNAKQFDFLEGQPVKLSESGELLDFWGAPLVFRRLSAEELEIRSAGPDRLMLSEDDLIVK